MAFFVPEIPLLAQLESQGLEFDQKLRRAFEVSASKPDLDPEDIGFPDSYLTLALYRLNSVLSSVVTLDESRLNLFHDYKKAEPCSPEQVRPGFRLCRVLPPFSNSTTKRVTRPPREARCGGESLTLGRRTQHDWWGVRPNSGDQIVLTALGAAAAGG